MHVIVSTHQLGDLPVVIESILDSITRSDTLVVTCDAIVSDVDRYVRELAVRVPCPIVLVQRSYKGAARRGQNRNNGVRAICDRIRPGDWLYFVDGDVCPDARHFAAVQGETRADVIIGRVVRLSAADSDAFRQDRAFRLPLGGRLRFAAKAGKARVACAARRHGPAWVRDRIPTYWPDLRSGNFAVRADTFLAVNGFDETMTGWGIEDSDLGLRLYRGGALPSTFPWFSLAVHLWHPSAPVRPNPERTREWLSQSRVWAKHGLVTPFGQTPDELRIDRYEPTMRQEAQA